MTQSLDFSMRKTNVWPHRIAWGLQGVLALLFATAGGAKLIGVPMMVELFDMIGWGEWFRYVTGGIEVASAALLLNARTAWIAAVLLICTMVGAAITTVMVVDQAPVGPVVLGTALAAVLWLRRPLA